MSAENSEPFSSRGDVESMEELVSLRWLLLDTGRMFMTAATRRLHGWSLASLHKSRLRVWGAMMMDPVLLKTVSDYLKHYVPEPAQAEWLMQLLLGDYLVALSAPADEGVYWRILQELPIPPAT